MQKYYNAVKTILEMANDRGYKNKLAINKNIFKIRFEAFDSGNNGALDIHFKNFFNKLVVSFNNNLINERINKTSGKINYSINDNKVYELCKMLKNTNKLKKKDDIILIIDNYIENENIISQSLKEIIYTI